MSNQNLERGQDRAGDVGSSEGGLDKAPDKSGARFTLCVRCLSGLQGQSVHDL